MNYKYYVSFNYQNKLLADQIIHIYSIVFCQLTLLEDFLMAGMKNLNLDFFLHCILEELSSDKKIRYIPHMDSSKARHV